MFFARREALSHSRLFSFENKTWTCPSINAHDEILYSASTTDLKTENIFIFNTSLQSVELVNGTNAQWYDPSSFLFIQNGEVCLYHMDTLSSEPYLAANQEPIQLDINPYAGDGMYLSCDKKHLVYASSIEEKYLGFISSGYFHKVWTVLDLSIKHTMQLGKLEESLDNILAN